MTSHPLVFDLEVIPPLVEWSAEDGSKEEGEKNSVLEHR